MARTAGLTRTELGNFARFCLRNPRATVASAAFYAEKAFGRLLRRLPPHYRYPSRLRGCLTTACGPSAKQVPLRLPAMIPMLVLCTDGRGAHEREILLARGEAKLADIEPRWQLDYQDWEQIQSLHRWNWLLTKLTAAASTSIRPWGLEKIRSWLNVHGQARQYTTWNTYAVTERLANSLIFCLRAPAETGDQLIPPWMATEMESHAVWIVNHLEFYGGGIVGNHILNNARGVYFYGRVFGERRFERLATELLAWQLPSLLSPSGFLREGSSHYHFLITRWLLEIFWLAQISNDGKTAMALRPYVVAAVERCWFFLVRGSAAQEWHLPLVGDISPDFPPAWLMDIGWSAPAMSCFAPDPIPPPPKQAGWAALFPGAFRGSFFGSGGTQPEGPSRRGVTAFPDDGWYRLDHDPFTAIWHVEPRGVPLHPSHGHCDTGSFCLYLDGEPVLVDPGRYGYTTEDRWSTSAAAHNALRLDGLDPFVYDRFYPTFYRVARVTVAWETEPAPSLVVCHDGFSRIGDQITHRRTWRIREGGLEIHDELDGPGEHVLETFFQWAPGLKIMADGAMVDCRLGATALCRLERSGSETADMELASSWFFPAYGRRTPAATLIYRQRGKLPMANRYLIRLTRVSG